MHMPHAHAPRARRNALAAAILAACAATLAHAGAEDAAPTRPASNIVVANCDDSGAGSLRWALGLATDGDTIDLTQLTCGTITLTSGQLLNDRAISLVGPGADQLTIDGNASSRVLASYAKLAISDLTIANGSDLYAGGCLYAVADTTLTRVTVSGCVAGDGGNPNAVGGGIYFLGDGTLTLVSSRVTGNTAQSASKAYGGGIFVSGNGGGDNSQVHLIDSRVDGNHAYAGNGNAFGGGIVIDGSATTVTFQNSSIDGNRAISTNGPGIGGGVFIRNTSADNISQLTMHGGRISGNLAEGAIAEGGGIITVQVNALLDGGSLVSANIARSTFPTPSTNSTALGGGILALFGSLALTDVAVDGNQSIAANGDAVGGGVLALAPLTATRATIRGNTAQSITGNSFGGGVSAGIATYSVITMPVELHACTISDNTARSNGASSTSRGGGVDAIGTILAAYSTIRDNAAIVTGSGSGARGGGLASTCAASSTDCGVTVRASTVSGNSVSGGDGDGGGIATSNGVFAAYNSTIAFNSAPSRGGGVIAAADSASKAISSIIANNTAPAGADISLPLGMSGAFTVIGEHDLIVDASGSVTLPTDTLHSDPKLLPLADNGGATATHALAACSPAIDAGSNPSGFEHDQRLAPYARVYGSAVDIGAFEVQPDADRIFGNGFEASPCP